jgi:membrane associated rhomboid family serine protease
MPLSVRWRYKLDRWRSALAEKFRSQPAPAPRPRLCPACGMLVGAGTTRCHQCGASMTYSLAAASRSLTKMMPHAAPITYSIVGLDCLLYGLSLLMTIQRSGGFDANAGGLRGILLSLGGISGTILLRLGESVPMAYAVSQPWRLVMAVFLHGSLIHIGFNMMTLVNIGPMVEETYGSARFFFIYVLTGFVGCVASSTVGNFSVGASGAILGLVGVLLAQTAGSKSASMRQQRSQLISWLISIAVLGFVMRGMIDNYAHAGGFAAGYLLGKRMPDRHPADTAERRRADVLGWTAGLVVAASFVSMLISYFATARPLG